MGLRLDGRRSPMPRADKVRGVRDPSLCHATILFRGPSRLSEQANAIRIRFKPRSGGIR
jgi:hypothetical protein